MEVFKIGFKEIACTMSKDNKKKIGKLEVMMSNNNKRLDMRISGVIGKNWWDDTNPQEINYKLDNAKDVDEIYIKINSNGGNIIAGIAIFNSIKNHGATNKTVEIDGMCASIATIIAMAGTTIKMNELSLFMIHKPSVSGTGGTAEDLRATADHLDKMLEVVIPAYMSKVKLTREELDKKLEKDTYLTPAEALADGFITEIIPVSDDTKTIMELKGDMVLMNGIEYQTNPYMMDMVNKYDTYMQNTNKNRGDEKMTYEEFKKNHPEMFAKVKNEGVIQERTRMENLDKAQEKAGIQLECIKKAKYTTFSEATTMEVFEEIIEETTLKAKEIKAEVKPKTATMEELFARIDDSKMSGATGEVKSGGEIETKLEKENKEVMEMAEEIAKEGY